MTDHPQYHIAIHEAGHAVIMACFGMKFKDVPIRPHRNLVGRLKKWKRKALLLGKLQRVGSRGYYTNDTLDRKVKSEISSLYAGWVAELKAGVNTDDTIAGSDHDAIRALALAHIGGEGEDLDNFLALSLEDTKRIVNEHWHRIEALAALLLDKAKITGNEVSVMINGA